MFFEQKGHQYIWKMDDNVDVDIDADGGDDDGGHDKVPSGRR